MTLHPIQLAYQAGTTLLPWAVTQLKRDLSSGSAPPASTAEPFSLESARLLHQWCTVKTLPHPLRLLNLVPNLLLHNAPRYFARLIATDAWRDMGLEPLQKSTPPLSTALVRAADLGSSRPHAPGLGLSAAYVCSYFGSAESSSGLTRFNTPLSAYGPGCNGGVLALVNVRLPPHLLSAVTATRLGRAGLFRIPFAPVERLVLQNRDGSVVSCIPQDDSFFQAVKATVPCRLCGAPQEDIFHVLSDSSQSAPTLPPLRHAEPPSTPSLNSSSP